MSNELPHSPERTWDTWRVILLAFSLALINIFTQSMAYSVSNDIFLSVGLGGLSVMVMVRGTALRAGVAPTRLVFASRPDGRSIVLAALAATAALIPTSLLAGISTTLRPPSESWLRFYNEQLPEGLVATLVACTAVVVLAPIAEEIVFRGLLLRACRRHWGIVPSAVLTGLLFGLSHGEPWALFGLIPLGILLALITEATGSIIPAIVAHSVHNAISFGIMLANGGLVMPEDGEQTPWLLLSGSLAALACILLLLLRRQPGQRP